MDAAMKAFLARTKKGPNCWIWIGHIDSLGYGRFKAMGEVRAHRLAWRLFKGETNGMKVLHKCDVRNCVNPEHLFLGTQADNVADMMAKRRHRSVPLHGERNPMAVLRKETVEEMKLAKLVTGKSYRLIALDFGVSTMTAYRAITGQSWSN